MKGKMLNTLRQRILLSVGLSALMCMLLLGIVSYFSISAMKENRLQTAIEGDLHQYSEQMEREYMTLVQLSQQMMPQGSIGSLIEEYLTADNPYDKGVYSREISENMSLLTFANRQVQLLAYLIPQHEDYSVWLSNFGGAGSEFDLNQIPSLSTTAEITYQALHPSKCSFLTNQVISITRPVIFPNGQTAIIYVEMESSIIDGFQNISQSQNIPVQLAQVSENGKVFYSTCTDLPTGSQMNFESGKMTGQIGDYIWVGKEMEFGFSNVLLMPSASYNREINLWKLATGLVFLVGIGIVLLVGITLMRLIYRPLQMLDEEMIQLGQGKMDRKEHQFHIEEFDQLFGRFNQMKEQIASLMEDARAQERERRQLELDKLYYQINPHFLMNALNSVHWMAAMHGQTEIDTFISQLNYILGYSMGKVDRRATLRTEIKSLVLYLELQKTRYDFQTWMDIEEGIYLDQSTARLILQPLAENAVCHNMDEFGNLWVSVHNQGDKILITMKDDGKGFDSIQLENSSQRMNKGIGLRYVELSLQSFYGDQASMTISSELGHGTIVSLTLPNHVSQQEIKK